MSKVGAQRAAELTGKSVSTIQRAMKNGKMSVQKDTHGNRTVDISELERVFGLIPQSSGGLAVAASSSAADLEEKMQQQIEIERLKMKVKMLEEQVESLRDQLDDTKAQRGEWQKQAQQVLIPSQYSQKQNEELRGEIQAHKKKAQEQVRLMQQRKKQAQMQRGASTTEQPQRPVTSSETQSDGEGESGSTEGIGSVWKRLKSGTSE